MKMLKIPQKNLTRFIENLAEFGELHAPQKKDTKSYAFGKVEDIKNINLKYNRTILPLKKYMLKPTETIFEFNPESGYKTVIDTDNKKKVIFGVHACDIKALEILDMVMGENYMDHRYFEKRKNLAIIGISCEPDEYCFCHSMQAEFVESGYDLFFTEVDDNYVVTVKTSLGDDMVLASARLFQEVTPDLITRYKKKMAQQHDKLSRKTKINISYLPEIFELEYQSEVWKEYGERCLSCGSCTMVCPTCFCYDVYDEIALDQQQGVRKKRWDSCFFSNYALVAGGENFRGERFSRFRYRYLHKQEGFVSNYGRPSCTGCGRCIEVCPAGIDLRTVIQKIRGEL